MDLRRYLFENNISQKEFAKRIGYTPNYVNMLCKGRLKPFKPVAHAIKMETKGMVDYTRKEEE